METKSVKIILAVLDCQVFLLIGDSGDFVVLAHRIRVDGGNQQVIRA